MTRLQLFHCFCFFWLATEIMAIDTLYVCPGGSIQLEATPDQVGYTWTPSIDLSNPNIVNPIATPTQSRLYQVESITIGPNRIINGDFEQGNTGFTSDYNYTAVATFDQGVYGIFTSPTMHNTDFGRCSDHTSASAGHMMTVDASTSPNQTVWCSKVSVSPNTTYIFSAWMTSLVSTSPGVLSFNINGDQIGQTLNVNSIVCNWEQFYAEWASGNATTATICLINENLEPFGNDFALDDISFAEKINSPVDSFAVIVLPIYDLTLDTAVCASQSFTYLGQHFPPDTDTTFMLKSLAGCDSSIRLQVNLLDTIFQGFRIDTLCPGDTLILDGQSYTKDTLFCTTFSSLDACDSTVCTNIVFLTEQALTIDLTNPTCNDSNDGSITVTATAGRPPYTYMWADNNNLPTRNNLGEGFYQLTITDSKSCMASTSLTLLSPDALQLELLVIPPVCANDTQGVIQVITSGGTPPYEWSIDGLNFTTADEIGNLEPGNYFVQLQDANGCSVEATTSISAPPPVLVDIPDSLELPLGTTQVIQSRTNARTPVSYAWSPPTGLSCTDCPAPGISATESGVYQLQITDSLGCMASDSVIVHVIKNYQLFIPNIFSPNGDGTNDHFHLFASQEVASIRRFMIFDRWGAVIHERRNCLASANDCRWDGRRKGEKLNPGVYIYWFEVEFLDGKLMTYSGDVTLVR